MSTDLSGQAENAPTPPEERAGQPSDSGAPRSAPAPTSRQDADDYQNMAAAGSPSPAESEQTPAPQGRGDNRDGAAAGGDAAVAASQGEATVADPSQQMAAQTSRQPAGGSTERAGGAGQSFIGDASAYARRWESIQVGFVDDPQAAVQEADTLVSDAMGDVVATFQQQRQQLEVQWSGGGQASTDDLRVAFQRYRDFFQRLLQI